MGLPTETPRPGTPVLLSVAGDRAGQALITRLFRSPASEAVCSKRRHRHYRNRRTTTFLASHGSWMLSPVFDVNPTSDLWRARSTSIMGADAQPDEAGALPALAEDCSLTTAQARDRMSRVARALTTWREQARTNGVREQEIVMMAESIQPRLEAVLAAANTLVLDRSDART